MKITGVTKDQALKYMAPYIDPATVGTENPVTLRRRLFNVEVASIPSAIRNKLMTDRYVSVSWSQVRNYIRNRMTNVTAGSEDFHLKSGSALIDVGTDTSGDAAPLNFTDDIDGQTRPTGAGTWDIGADEYVAVFISGSTCWGHSTGVTQTNTRTFLNNWTGTGHVEGLTGDPEYVGIHSGDYLESEVVQVTPYYVVTLAQNQYQSGDTMTLKYRTGASEAACLAASWNTYSSDFQSLGYVQIRLESTL